MSAVSFHLFTSDQAPHTIDIIHRLRMDNIYVYVISLGRRRVWVTLRANIIIRRFRPLWHQINRWWDQVDGPYYWAKFKLMLTGHYAPYYVNVYDVDRCYGGPEEGSWYYDCGTPNVDAFGTASIKAWSETEAKLLMDKMLQSLKQPNTHIKNGVYVGHLSRYSVIGGPDVELQIESLPAARWPTRRPHYE
jgi:hypothetical protein